MKIEMSKMKQVRKPEPVQDVVINEEKVIEDVTTDISVEPVDGCSVSTD